MSYGYSSDPGYGYGSGLLRSLAVRGVPIIVALVIAAFTMTRGCQEGPFGRKQLVAINTQEETALGAQAFQEILAENQRSVVNDPDIVNAVRRVARNLVKGTSNEDFVRLVKLPP